jgi:hypothetical protein
MGQSQGGFARMIGASRDTVVSWELGRNRVSPAMARRIWLATGAEEEGLIKGRTPVMAYLPMTGKMPFTLETLARHRKSPWGRSDEAAALEHWKLCTDAVRLVFLAAARTEGEDGRHQLPAVVDSFTAWCQSAVEDFDLMAEIDAQLQKRTRNEMFSKTYREWRRMQREDPDAIRGFKFKDDPTKPDDETLSLPQKTIPAWLPGKPMREAVPVK